MPPYKGSLIDPYIFSHMEGLYYVHQVDLQSGEGGEIICFEFYISHAFY